MSMTSHGRQKISILAIAIGLAMATSISTAQAAGNDMVEGGCTTKADCAAKISHDKALYAAHSVTPAGVNSPNTVAGSVTRDGRVIVDGKVVATNAYSYGRQDIPGSTKSGSIYKRPTSVSFQQEQLPAWVRVYKGEFKYAILNSCGNIVTATPKAAAKTTPAKAAPQPTPAPVINIQQTQTQVQTQTQTQPAPTPAPTPQPVATVLPQTGASTTAGLIGILGVIIAAWYYVRSRRDLAFARRR